MVENGVVCPDKEEKTGELLFLRLRLFSFKFVRGHES